MTNNKSQLEHLYDDISIIQNICFTIKDNNVLSDTQKEYLHKINNYIIDTGLMNEDISNYRIELNQSIRGILIDTLIAYGQADFDILGDYEAMTELAKKTDIELILENIKLFHYLDKNIYSYEDKELKLLDITQILFIILIKILN